VPRKQPLDRAGTRGWQTPVLTKLSRDYQGASNSTEMATHDVINSSNQPVKNQGAWTISRKIYPSKNLIFLHGWNSRKGRNFSKWADNGRHQAVLQWF
jgi:hypothetical protein